MSIQKGILDALVTKINALSSYATLVIGSLPDANGLSIAVASGGLNEATLSHGGEYNLSFVLNGKHANQGTVMDALATIHDSLNKTTDYPTGTGWKVTSIQTNGAPSYLGRDETQWLYGSSLSVKYVVD